MAVGYTYAGSHRDVLTLRYNSNGTLDATFGTGGMVTYSTPGAATDIGFGVAIQAAGRIVVVGASVANSKDDVLVLRLNVNGTLDGNFATGGVFTFSGASDNSDYGNAVALREDGRIVVLGAQSNGSALDILLLQLNAGGALDSEFGVGGVVVYGAAGSLNDYGYGLVIQKDGKIVITGYTQASSDNVLVARFNADGALDTSFGSGGAVIWNGSADGMDYGQGIALQPDGRLIIPGFSHNGVNEDMLVMRLWASADDGRRCFIATAAYGSDLDPHVVVLRQFRDEHLMTNWIGWQLTKLYYTYSPPLAAFIEHHDFLKPAVRGLLTPIILTVKYPDIMLLEMAMGGIPCFIILMRHRLETRKRRV